MREVWTDPKFAKKYTDNATNPTKNWYEYEVNLPNLISLIPGDTESILDFGSGPGDVTHSLREKFHLVEGCDSSDAMLSLAREQFAGIKFFHWDGLSQLDDKDGFYDCVFSKLTVHFIKDLQAFAPNIKGVLKEGGCFVFSVPHPMRSLKEIGEESYWNQVNYVEEIGRYGLSTTFIHRSIEAYFKPFREESFALTGLNEPEIGQSIVQKYNVDSTYASIPRRLNIRFEKQLNNQ